MTEFDLPDMTCSHCVGTVTRALKDVDPSCTVDVDLANRKVRVESAVPSVALADALSDAGYPPA